MNVVWHSVADFAAMGGYATYVWGSMAAVAAGLAVEVSALRARTRAVRRAIALNAAAKRHAGGRP
jgi:heme exporter protein D